MKQKNHDKQNLRETAEYVYYLLLPLLCIAALLRGCSVRAKMQEPQASAGVQQVVESGETQTEEEAAPYTGGQGSEDVSYTGTGDGETAGTVETSGGNEKGGKENGTEEAPSVRRNSYDPDKFIHLEDSGQVIYDDENYETLQGIDVSDHQGEIDWKAVADAGYEFVFVRVGFRGYGEEGTLNEDTMALDYMKDAKAAGLKVGTFFFSQAVNEEEAAEEGRFAAEIIKKSGVKTDLPLVYDPEQAGGSEGRANDLTREEVSANAAAFRDAAKASIGGEVALYTNLFWQNTYFDLDTLNDFEIWYADYEEAPQTNIHFTWWQYTETGSVPGIKGDMDLNIWIRRID